MTPTKPLSSILGHLNQEELGSLLEACGFAIRHDTILSAALDEIGSRISHLRKENGSFDNKFADVIDDFDLSLLAILTATKLVEITAVQGTSLYKSLLSKRDKNV